MTVERKCLKSTKSLPLWKRAGESHSVTPQSRVHNQTLISLLFNVLSKISARDIFKSTFRSKLICHSMGPAGHSNHSDWNFRNQLNSLCFFLSLRLSLPLSFALEIFSLNFSSEYLVRYRFQYGHRNTPLESVIRSILQFVRCDRTRVECCVWFRAVVFGGRWWPLIFQLFEIVQFWLAIRLHGGQLKMTRRMSFWVNLINDFEWSQNYRKFIASSSFVFWNISVESFITYTHTPTHSHTTQPKNNPILQSLSTNCLRILLKIPKKNNFHQQNV